MHELSIAVSIVEMVEENLPSEDVKVKKVNLRIGNFAGVVKDALLFSFEIAAKDSQLENATVEIEELPLIIYCDACDKNSEIGNPPIFRCEFCGEATPNIVQGKELEIVSVELEDDENN